MSAAVTYDHLLNEKDGFGGRYICISVKMYMWMLRIVTTVMVAVLVFLGCVWKQNGCDVNCGCSGFHANDCGELSEICGMDFLR